MELNRFLLMYREHLNLNDTLHLSLIIKSEYYLPALYIYYLSNVNLNLEV